MQVNMIVASTLDGFIAQKSAQSSLDWTSLADKIFFTKKSKAVKFIVMGLTTFETVSVEKMRRERVIIVLSPEPEKLAAANLTWAEIGPETLEGIVAVKMAAVELMAALEKKNIKELLVCGGARVYQQFWQTGRIERLFLTLEPIFFGQGISLGEAVGLPKTEGQLWQKMQLVKCEKLMVRGEESETLMLELKRSMA